MGKECITCIFEIRGRCCRKGYKELPACEVERNGDPSFLNLGIAKQDICGKGGRFYSEQKDKK